MPLTIGKVAQKTGCSVATLRYYESIGLVPQAPRSANGRRSYEQTNIALFSFVRRARDLGLTLEHIRQLLSLDMMTSADCQPAQTIIAAHLQSLRRKREELAQLEKQLSTLLDHCGPACCGPTDPCSILASI